MKTIEEIVAALNALIEGADNEDRDLTEDEVRSYEALEAELAKARTQAEIRSRNEMLNTPRGGLQINTKTATSGADTLERAFEDYIRTGKENADITELRAQSSGSNTAGGYTVPPGWRDKIVDRLKEFGGLANEAETIVTDNGESVEFPTLDDTSNVGEIVSEGGTFASGADMVFGTKALPTYRYASGGASNLPVKISVELLQDSAFDVQALVTRKLAERIGRVQADHWVNGLGSGSSQPQGLIASKSAFDNLTNTGVFTYDELIDVIHAVDPAYRMNAKWLMNDSTLARIRKVVDANERPLWLPANESGMTALPGGTLLGYPVVIDQAVPSSGDATKLLAFGDFRESYVIRRVKDIQVVVLNELYAPNGQVGIFAWARAGGIVQNANSYVVLADKDTP